jgi:acetyl-CoA/propionyl-CoA carboxylase biotin carboxyl carrier protein
MRRALADYRIGGVITTIPFHQLALAHPAFAAGEATVNFIPEHLTTELANLSADAPELSAHNLASADSNTARMFDVEVNGRRFSVRVSEQGVQAEPDLAVKRRQQSTDSGRRSAAKAVAPTNGVVSTLQGTIVAVRAVSGQAVEAGQVLFIVEAMKMENEIAAPHAGVIAEVRAQTGQIVEPGMLLAIYQQ